MIIGLLGPEGTFSEKAAKLWCSKWNMQSTLQYFTDIPDIVELVISDSVDCGIVPIENSIEGSVGVTLDSLLEYKVNIIGEVIVPIKHCLLALGKIEDIKVILSHPQALAQCRKYIKKHFKNTETRATGSTAHAASLAKYNKEFAAIADAECADTYGLKILDSDIQDHKENFTRFVVLSKYRDLFKNTSNNFKTSIIVYLHKDRPGALYELLGEFAIREINLTKIESRPTKRALGDYLFYIDMIGSVQDKVIINALTNIEKKVDRLKVIGSYPRDIP
ncbi:MAG TPA: prephenate dehydratase [Methanosarcinales archaeon]|nr:prephenate dehydratase [Methanosarcinales archaeon]